MPDRAVVQLQLCGVLWCARLQECNADALCTWAASWDQAVSPKKKVRANDTYRSQGPPLNVPSGCVCVCKKRMCVSTGHGPTLSLYRQFSTLAPYAPPSSTHTHPPTRAHTHHLPFSNGHTHKTTTTDDDDAATHHLTYILNSFIYLYWVTVEILTAFFVGINGISVSVCVCGDMRFRGAGQCFVSAAIMSHCGEVFSFPRTTQPETVDLTTG